MPNTKTKGSNKRKGNKNKGKKLKLFRDFIGIASWVTVIMLWLTAGSAYINPSQFRYLSVLGLAFPFTLAGVLVMLAVCLIFARRKSWIPLLGLATCFCSIRDYCPVNIPSTYPKRSYKFITYNTMGFATSTKDSAREESLLEYLVNSKADFLCFQEGNCVPYKLLSEKIFPRLDKALPFHDTIRLADNVLGCSSRFPIVKKERLCLHDMNGAGVFYMLLGEKDTLRLINCHLQSMGLSSDDRKQYHEIVKHLNDSNVENHSRLLISKISKASVHRAVQAVKVAEYIERNQGKNIVVCGDFNDTPISYAYHRIHSTGLTDAYRTTANGIGRSFNRDAIYVRIDHLFCSEHWKPYSFHVDKSIASSDHYPLVGHLKRIK